MRLKNIIENLSGIKKIEGRSSLEIKGLTCNSKAVQEGYLFIAVKGSRLDGTDFITEAIDRGACAVMLEWDCDRARTFKRGNTFIYVTDARAALSESARAFYGDVSSKMQLIGITGTNGKTTTSYLVESLFNIKSEKAGVISTINYRFGKRLIPSLNTTPGVLDIYFLLSSMERESVKNCILEASSHSLEQGRVDTLHFDIAIFTNLTKEHLDYHRTMENYLTSKLKLFTKIKPGGCAIVNSDDPSSEKILKTVRSEKKANIITYGIERDADVSARDIESSFEGLRFKLCVNIDSSRLAPLARTVYSSSPSTEFISSEVERLGINSVEKKVMEINSRLIGRHNVYNILASASCGIAMGMRLEQIAAGIEKISTLPGRLEHIDCGQDFLVFVDYAHTEDGMENVLKALRELRPRRLLTVFGCGGDRDNSKRPNMGRVSFELSDKIFITSDNPRGEDPLDIIKEITEGIASEKNSYVIEVDRHKAIDRALKEAGPGDIVLVAGKGHETYQVFKDVTIPFDDRETVRRILCSQ